MTSGGSQVGRAENKEATQDILAKGAHIISRSICHCIVQVDIAMDISIQQTVSFYTEAKVDVAQEIEQRAQQAAQPGADHCTLCSISSVTSNLASV